MSFNEGLVKQKAVHPHHETLPSNEQEQTIDTYNNLVESPRNYKWKIQSKKVAYYATYVTFLK